MRAHWHRIAIRVTMERPRRGGRCGAGWAVGRLPPGGCRPRGGGRSSGRPCRAGACGRRGGRGLPPRHRARRCSPCPGSCRAPSPPPAADMADHLTAAPGRPDVPGRVPRRRRRPDPGAPRPRGHGRGDPRPPCGSEGGGGLPPLLRLAHRAQRLVVPHFIDRNFDGVASIAAPAQAGARPRPARRVPPPRRQGAATSSPTRGSCSCSASRRSTPASPPSTPSPSTRSSPTWTPSRACTSPRAACTPWPLGLAEAAEKAGATFAYGATVERIVRRSGTSGPVTGVRLTDRRAGPGRRRRLQPRPARRLPHARARGADAAQGPARASTRRRARCGSPASEGRRPGRRGPPQHPLRRTTTAPSGAAHSTRRGRLQPDPSILVTVQNHTDPSLAPAGCTCIYVLEPTPNLDGRVDWSFERERAKERTWPACEADGLPDLDVVVERFVDPTDWEAQGMERGAPFALSHRFLQTGPFRPNNVDKRVPGLVFVGSGTVPGRGRAHRAAVGPSGRRTRGARLRGRPDGDHPRGQLRALPAAEQAPRHHLLLVDPAAARGSSAPTSTPSTASAATPTTSSTTSAPVAGRGARRRPGRLRRPLLHRPRRRPQRRPGAQGRRAHRPGLRPRCRPPSERFLRSMTMDLDRRLATRPTTTCSATWTARRPSSAS